MSNLDDLLSKKKTIVPVLDLSKTVAQSKEEFKRLMEKVPDYKMRPIKVRGDEIKIKERDYLFKPPRKEVKKILKSNGEREPLYSYHDPTPVEMRGVVVMELCAVPIDWKMLTTLRPKTKVEEEYFSKLIEMGKLQLKTEVRDKREITLNSGVRKVKNKSGIIETRLVACPECGEELCNGCTCVDFNYDLYVRVEVSPAKPKQSVKSTNNKGRGSGTVSGGINTSGSSRKGKKKIKRRGKSPDKPGRDD